MSELTFFLIRIAYLAILWIFVLAAISVIRSDMFGARVPESARTADAKQGKQGKAPKQPKQRASKRRGVPTHVAVTQGSNVGATATLDRAPILIGRGSDAAIRLDDDYVSTRHARIAASGDQWFVEDLGSTNGTYIGSVRLTQPTTITLGTEVRIGKTIVELRK
ncbi:antibiotic biosynthesis regulator FhaB [Nocardioides marinquilinus]|uniref:Antibiotic biosynthesis regulator FhaB n=1 Tax=Nocardioides marinquilinus TaxID=1210400 RepID=A0ABP9P4C8_9ACTN